MKFKHLNCPCCGKQLVNLEEGHEERGLFRYWCDVCDIDVTIDVNKNPSCDDEEI